MKAIVQHRYGTPEVLSFEDIDKPEPKDDEVLVRVQAASVNAYDWHHLTGTPFVVRLEGGLRKPKVTVPGVDFAGQVEAVGRDVTQFQAGDEVLGMRGGAYAEYLCVREARIVRKSPAELTFEQAAAIPMAGVTALQGLRDKGGIQRGHHVLINGASGGVGTFAVQIAKALGAEVTGVCRTRNVELVRSLGADHVLDYTSQDFTSTGQRYDLILDIVGSQSMAACKRVLTPHGKIVMIGGAVSSFLRALVASKLGNDTVVPMLAKGNQTDLTTLLDMFEAGWLTPVIDRRYPLSAVAEALAYMGTGHARAKIVITE